MRRTRDEEELPGQWAPRSNRGDHHGPWCPFPSLIASVVSRDASISHAFIARLLLAFAFKWRMNLVHIRGGVHRIA